MRNVIVAIVTLAISSAFSARAEWALVKILRDEPLPAPQRVAFIGSAEVKEVQGKAERLSGIDTWTPLRTDIRLEPGDMVRTQNGSVTIKMIDSRSFIKITPNTVLRLVPLDSNSDRSSLTGLEEQNGFVVRSCRGQAVFREANQWKPVRVNSVLPESALIRTEPASTVDLFCTRTKRAIHVESNQQIDLANTLLLHQPAASLASIRR